MKPTLKPEICLSLERIWMKNNRKLEVICNARDVNKDPIFTAHPCRSLCVTISDNQCKSSTVHHAEPGISIHHTTLRREIGGAAGDGN